MKKRTSSMSRRIVSLLMSMVLTLTLVTPAAFAEGMGAYANGEGTAVTTPADIATQEGEDTSVSVAQRTVTVKQYHANEAYEVKIVVGVEADGTTEKLDTTYTINADTKTVTLRLTKDGNAGEPVYIKTALNDVLVTEGENQTPALTTGEPTLEYTLPNEGDVTLYYGTQADFNAPVAQRKVTVEKYHTDAAYEVKIVVGVEEAGTTEKLDTTYAIGADTKTVTLRLTTDGYAGEPIYIKTALDDVLVTAGENQTPALTKDTTTLEYPLPEEGDVTLYYGTQADFVSAWYGDGTATDYYIRTAEELAYLSALTNGTDGVGFNAFEDKFVSLTRNIDLSAYPDWMPIGYGYSDFEGTFNGNDYTVTVNMDKRFSREGEDSIANSITIGIIGRLRSGTVKNLTVAGSITVTNDTNSTVYVGAIAGLSDMYGETATIERCKNAATIEIAASGSGEINAGGIVGATEQKTHNKKVHRILNCLNEGNVVVHVAAGSTVNVAGIAGAGRRGNPISSCWNTGDVSVTAVEGANVTSITVNAAGIAGKDSNVTSCANYGNISTPSNFEGSTAGIIGVVYQHKNGLVTNSYNVGDITRNKEKTFGIGKVGAKGKIENSYYLCKRNDAEEMAYVNGADTKDIAYNDEDKTYTVVEDAALLVKKLNDNRGSNTAWFVNRAAGVYFPIHVLSWTGDRSEEFGGVTISITYDPNGGMTRNGSTLPVTESVTLEPDVNTGEWTAASHTVLAVNSEEIGFVNENGEIKATPWNTAKDGTGTEYNAGDFIVFGPESEDITLYAQWETIWDTDEDGAYLIKNPTDLKSLQTQVNDKGFDYTGKWFRLTENIALTDEWTPIGKFRAEFCGNLDGNHKSISGLNVNTSTPYAGLFGTVGEITVQSLTLQDGSVICTGATSWCGGLAGNGSLLLSDVHIVNMAISGDGIGGTGGILGGGYASMTACSNTGGSVSGRYAGGLAGRGNTNGTDFIFTDCNNSAAVTGRNYAGGMAGSDRSESMKFTNCSNAGNIRSGGPANGIAAAGTFVTCTNTGAISSSQGQANGIADYAKDITQCGNTGAINGSPAAGIARRAMRIEKCYNTGKITATAGDAAAYGIAESVNGYIKNSFTYNVDTQVPLVSNIKVGTYGDKNEVTNSYYLASSATAVSSAGEYATLADFASGKVAWGVDGGTAAHANYWTQDTRRGQNQMPAGPGRAYPKPIEDPNTEFSVYRALVQYGTGGTATLEANSHSSENQENAVYGMKGTSVTVTATPKDDTFGLKSLTLDLMGTGSTAALESGDSFTLGEANALVVATFASTGNGGSGGGTGGNGGDGDGTGTDTGDGAGDENDEGLQDGLNMDVEYNIKGLVLAAYAEWGANGGGKTFAQWLKASPSVLRAFITNSLDNMAAAAKSKDTDEAKGLAALLLASLNEHSGLNSKNGDIIGKALQRYMDTGSEATFSTWLTTGSGMASGTVEEILAQYTDSLLNLTERLYANWESSGTSLTFPVWLDAQQVTMESLSENAEEPEAEPDDTQTSEAPEDVPDGQEAEGGASGGGNSVWEVIGTVVRENPIIVWSIVAVVAALVIVGAVRRYHKVKRDERDDVASKK